MTKKEWLIHMLNGGKGTSAFMDEDGYIIFSSEEGKFKYSDGSNVLIECHKRGFAKYEEPKKMIKIAPYVYKYNKYNKGTVNHYVQTTSYYKDDNDFKKHYSSNEDIKFKRLTALEIEVEDYE